MSTSAAVLRPRPRQGSPLAAMRTRFPGMSPRRANGRVRAGIVLGATVAAAGALRIFVKE